ncbi:hypothetical protein OIV19_08445 [Brucella sp. HL-2]|nr:hypothetical protein [Brucella sp. HL-2]MCV9907642.1 hypothetical protein [Brucella sp. HL-2]
MLFDDPRLFDRATLMFPLIPWKLNPQPALSGKYILITAGEHDPISPLKLSQSVIGSFQAHGANVEALIAPDGHEICPVEWENLRNFLQ